MPRENERGYRGAWQLLVSATGGVAELNEESIGRYVSRNRHIDQSNSLSSLARARASQELPANDHETKTWNVPRKAE